MQCIFSSRSGGMVDAVDSKSTGGDLVGVRISPPAPLIKIKSGAKFYAKQKIR